MNSLTRHHPTPPQDGQRASGSMDSGSPASTAHEGTPPTSGGVAIPGVAGGRPAGDGGAAAAANPAGNGVEGGPAASGSGGNGGTGNGGVSARDVQLVQNLIERCMQQYIPQNQVVSLLHSQAKIEPSFTRLVWGRLEEQNPDFFAQYHLR
jgi:uncharacterized protein (TIGR01589 family)